jgi:hypothetical protein
MRIITGTGRIFLARLGLYAAWLSIMEKLAPSDLATSNPVKAETTHNINPRNNPNPNPQNITHKIAKITPTDKPQT